MFKQFGVLPVLFLHMIFPLIFSIGKIGMQYAPFSFFISLRALSCGLVSLLVYALFINNKKSIARAHIPLFLQAGLFGIYLTFIPEFWSLQYLSVGKVAFLFVLAPFFTALFARILGLEIFSWQKIIGLIIGLLGFIPVLISKTGDEGSFSEFLSFDLPELTLIFAVACYAYSWIVIKKLIHKEDYSPWLVSGFSMVSGGTAALITSFFYDGWYQGICPVTHWWPLLGSIGALMSIAITCFVLYIYLLREYSATLISFFGFTRSFFGALYGWLFFRETISWIYIPSILVVSLGLYLFSKDEF